MFVNARGERLAALTDSDTVPVLDTSPRFAPDGRTLAFVSTRGRRSLDTTSVWLMPATTGATPRRLTYSDESEREPAWLPDGAGVVFASNREGTFDLWLQRVARDQYGALSADGPPVRLTDGPGHERSPSVSPDGAQVVFMATSVEGATSRLELVAIPAAGRPAQPPRRLTEGPADYTPAWSPDGRRVAFSAPSERGEGQRADADLYLVDADGDGRRRMVDEPLADQTGPVWSRDGRLVFATSVYRSISTGDPVLASVTFVDLDESPPILRALHDPVAVESRTGVALDGRPLDLETLRTNLGYRDALKRAVEQELIRIQERARRP